MTVIAGLWRFDGADRTDLVVGVDAMIGAHHRAPAGRPEIVTTDGLALGYHDQTRADELQPARPTDAASPDRPIVVADARIDNRSELLSSLGIGPGDAPADPALAAAAYRRWGERIVDHLLGDYAIAAWHPAERALVLIRDPTGQRPLHYAIDARGVAFASLPRGLFAAGISAEPDLDRLARFVADQPAVGAETFHAAIRRVEPGHVTRLTPAGAQSRNYWHMPTGELRYRRDADYIEAFREQLDRATRARLRDAGPLVATQLSAGLDSGAVTATAARLLAETGQRVLAITSAPRLGFDGPVPYGRIGDESGFAGAVAAAYPNIEHIVLRSDRRVGPLDHLADEARLFGQPVGLPCNNVWWRTVNATARARGARVILTGEMGNLTLSAGSLAVLPDFLRRGQLLRWAREVVALSGQGPRWRGLLAGSFAPWIPAAAWRALTRFSAQGRATPSSRFLLDPGASAGSAVEAGRRTERAMRWDLLRLTDSGNFRKGAALHWGIDERDPTADRRLVEFCFSLPPAQLVGGGHTRRLARLGLADRLPPAVIHGVRGYQYPDWYESLDRDRLAAFAGMVAAGPAARVIDFAAVDRLIADWPPGDWGSGRTIGTYRIGLLRALSAAAFALNAGG